MVGGRTIQQTAHLQGVLDKCWHMNFHNVQLDMALNFLKGSSDVDLFQGDLLKPWINSLLLLCSENVIVFFLFNINITKCLKSS